MSHCFISYHQEYGEFAQLVRQRLQQGGIPVWMQTTTAEACWNGEVDTALRDAFAVLVLVTPISRQSECITYEWSFALGLGIPVIPLLLEKTEPHPRLLLLSPLDFTTSPESVWDELVHRVRELSGLPAPDESHNADKTTETVVLEHGAYQDATVVLPADQATVRETLKESLHHSMRDVRIQASLMLAQFQEVAAVPVLIDALHDRDRDVHQHATWSLMHIGEPAIPALMDALRDPSNVVRKDVARIIGQIGTLEAVPALIAALHDESPEVRKAVADALGQVRSVEAVPSLLVLLHDSEDSVRRTAIEALGQIGDASVVDDLVLALQDSSKTVRVFAVWSLGQIRDVRAIPSLVALLRSSDIQLRQAAAEVLKEIGDPSIEGELTDALQDENNDVRRMAARVLAHIRGRFRQGAT